MGEQGEGVVFSRPLRAALSQCRERFLKTNKKSRLSHSELGSAACQPSAEAGAGPVAERARADEFDAVGGACGEASEMARFSSK